MLQYEVRDDVAEILFNNPPVNGITEEFLDLLMAALTRAGNDPEVRAIIIGSAIPGRFCGGLDLPAFLKSSPSLHHHQPRPLAFAVGGAAGGDVRPPDRPAPQPDRRLKRPPGH